MTDFNVNLVAYYDGTTGTIGGGGTTLIDNSTNSNTGTITAGPLAAASAVTGRPSLPLGRVFNGSTQYANVGNPSSLQLVGDMMLCAWVNPSALGSVGIIGKSGGSDPSSAYILWMHSDGKMEFLLGAGGSTKHAVSSAAAAIGTWVHVVGQITGTTMQTYINGVADGSPVTFSGTRQNSTDPLNIGRYYNGGLFWPGSIAELRIYNAAMGATFIGSLYAYGGAAGLLLRRRRAA